MNTTPTRINRVITPSAIECRAHQIAHRRRDTIDGPRLVVAQGERLEHAVLFRVRQRHLVAVADIRHIGQFDLRGAFAHAEGDNLCGFDRTAVAPRAARFGGMADAADAPLNVVSAICSPLSACHVANVVLAPVGRHARLDAVAGAMLPAAFALGGEPVSP